MATAGGRVLKFLADMGISLSTVRALRIAGHDAAHLYERGLDRLADSAVLDLARREDRVVLTFDLDFGDLLALGLLDSPSVVIFRLSDETPASVNPKLAEVLERCEAPLTGGAVVVVEDTRYRVRALPFGPG